MTGMPDYMARKVIDHISGRTDIGTLPTPYLALFVTMPTDAGASSVETDYTSYARKSVSTSDFNAAASSGPASAANANALTFATPTGNPTNGDVIGFGAWDASSGGNLLWFDYLGGFDWQPVTGDTADLLTAKAHGYVLNDRVVFSAEFGGAVPTGLTAGTLYHVISGGLTTDAFKVSATQGGSAVDITATGACMVRKVTPMTITNGVAPSFGAGQITIKAV